MSDEDIWIRDYGLGIRTEPKSGLGFLLGRRAPPLPDRTLALVRELG